MERTVARRALSAMLLAAFALALCITPASAATPGAGPALTPGSGYLALGDSVTFGYLENTVVPTPNYHDQGYFLGYPEHMAKELHVTVANPSCPGETSASLINAKAQSNGCENSLGSKVGYRTLYPLHVKYSGSQLAYAVHYLKTHPDVRLVSLMIGANDLFLCQSETKDACLSPAEQKPVLAAITRNVHTILSTIRHKAHYRGQIVIVNYYSLNYASPLVNAFSRTLNRAQDAGAAPFGVRFADGFDIYKAHARDFAGDTCAAALITHLTTGKCGVHPTFAGQSLLAEAILRVVHFI